MQPKLEDYLTIPQVAGILDRKPSTVWGWVNARRMKAVKVGNQWLIAPDDCRVPKYKPAGRPRNPEFQDF